MISSLSLKAITFYFNKLNSTIQKKLIAQKDKNDRMKKKKQKNEVSFEVYETSF